MKQKLDIWIGVMVLAGLFTATAVAQSLGEIARQERAKKGPPPVAAKAYTNDNLPTSGGLSEAGATSGSASSAPSATASKSEEKKEDQGKLEAEWRAKVKEQKDKIAMLERELDVSTREYKRRTAMFYADAAYSQQYPQQWAEEGRKYESEVKEKQKELADEKQKLEDMKEDLRKAGLPSSWSD